MRPAPSSSAAINLPAGAGPVAPANAAKLSLTLSQVVVEGGFDELQSQSAAITDRIVRRRITVADLYQAASELEKAYAAAGYVLVRVVVPPQKLVANGKVRLLVVDGFVESVDVNGLPESQRALIQARMAGLIGRRHLKLEEIERRLLLASDDPGLTLRSTLAPGSAPGSAKLVLEGTHQMVTGAVGIDNNQPKSLGSWAYNSSLQVNSPLGYGEQLYLTASSGYNLSQFFNGASPLQLFGGGFSFPVGVDGLTINPEYVNSVTRPIPVTGTPASVGYFQRFDFRVSYPLIRTRAQTLTLSSILEWDEEYLVPVGFGTDLYLDRYGVERLKADDAFQFTGGASAEATGVFSRGLGGRTGAGSNIPLSQTGASPDFSKLNLTLRWSQPLPQEFQLALIGQAQTSFGQPLMVAEQLAIDGPSGVSGYPTGTFSVDEGALLRAELGRPFALPINGSAANLTPYVFGAGARGVLDQPTAAQQGTIDATSVGLGVRTAVDANGLPLGASLGLEVARFYSDVANERQGWRGNLSFSVRF